MNKALTVCFMGLAMVTGIILGAALMSVVDKEKADIGEIAVGVTEIIGDVVDVMEEHLDKDEVEDQPEIDLDIEPVCGDWMHMPGSKWPPNAPWQPQVPSDSTNVSQDFIGPYGAGGSFSGGTSRPSPFIFPQTGSGLAVS